MFQGFSPETFDFLWDIRFNNNREWFAENKDRYLRYLYTPMKELCRRIEPAFAHVEGMQLRLSRIYRDMRMHPDTFYKDSLWFALRHREDYWLENPCLCFELRPEGYRCGFLLLRPSPTRMEQLRQKMAQKPEAFLAMVERAQSESGLRLDGDRYRRPKPCAQEQLREFYAMKNLYALQEGPPQELLFGPQLVEELKKRLLPWVELYRFCRCE